MDIYIVIGINNTNKNIYGVYDNLDDIFKEYGNFEPYNNGNECYRQIRDTTNYGSIISSLVIHKTKLNKN